MEYFIIALILYFLLRTGANLFRLLQGKSEASGGRRGQERRTPPRQQRWEGPSPREQTGAARDKPTFWGKDVEEATWHDLDDGPKANGPSTPNSRRYQTRT